MADKKDPVTRFLDGYSCSQAVLTGYCRRYDVDETTGIKIAAGFGAGMQRAKTCGAVTGAIMVLGLHFGDAGSVKSAGRREVYRAVQEFTDEFEQIHGTLNCRQLLGCDVNTPEGKQVAAQNNLFTTVCPDFVRDAAAIVDRIIEPG